MIESLSNSKVKYASKLKQKKYRSEFGEFLVEGEHLVVEAIKSDLVKMIFTTKELDYADQVTYLVSEEVMMKLSDLGESNSIVAVCMKPKAKKLSDRVLILEGIQDPGNMGTLIRTAAAFGFNTILAEQSVDFYNDKTIRSSQGGVFYVDLLETNIKEFILAHPQYEFYGTDVAHGINVNHLKQKHTKTGIILGNEGSGLSDEIKELVDVNLRIPMEATESLNVAIAGSILMFEVYRRK